MASLINMKGGVGKTTIASQLAHAAQADGLRVLAIDLDPQSNLSQSILGPRTYVEHVRHNRPTVVQILEDYIPASGSTGSPQRIDVNDVILRGVDTVERISSTS
ncbi:MAG: AAA family ATPase [Gammaproteobacteria bacterium]|nr:AAA family ATPase [Gammaproteobacteria bacterium]